MDDITQGICYLLGCDVEGTGKIVGEARAEGLEQLILDESVELAEEAVAEEIVLGLNVKGHVRLAKLRGSGVS